MKFKAILLALAIALASSTQAAKAQYNTEAEKEKTFSWGANLALNSAVIDNYDGFPNFGGGISIFALIPISRSFNFQPELGFQNYRLVQTNSEGTPHQGEQLEGGDNIYRITQYVTLPMLFQFDRFGGRNMWFVNLGPELKYCVANRDQHTESDHRTDYLSQTNRFTLALNLGFGMHVPVAEKLDFLWELRLASDLTSASKIKANTRHMSLDLKVGILYRL